MKLPNFSFAIDIITEMTNRKGVHNMKLLFIRHGDPDYVNDYLTEKGFREADLLAERIAQLDVRDFYCSTLGRAKATAKVALDRIGREAVICDWLREFPGYIIEDGTGEKVIPWDLLPGHWTTHSQLYDKDQWMKDTIMTTGDVEAAYRNITTHFDQLLQQYGYLRQDGYYRCDRGNTDTIVFFCHLGVQFAILSHLLGIATPLLWQGFFVAPTSVTTVVTEERTKGEVYFRCQALGDTSHLYVGKEPISYAGFFEETYQEI